MANLIGTYKNEKVTAQLTARLVPPNDLYPDCMCEVLMTARHLYVLEDNYDDTYQEHFVFTVGQIKGMETRVDSYQKDSQGNDITAIQAAAASFLGSLAGFTISLSPGKVKTKVKLLIITYVDGEGKEEKLFFRDLECSEKPLKRAYEKAWKELYGE